MPSSYKIGNFAGANFRKTGQNLGFRNFRGRTRGGLPIAVRLKAKRMSRISGVAKVGPGRA